MRFVLNDLFGLIILLADAERSEAVQHGRTPALAAASLPVSNVSREALWLGMKHDHVSKCSATFLFSEFVAEILNLEYFISSSSSSEHSEGSVTSLFRTTFMFVVRQRALLAAVSITAAKEEVRGSPVKGPAPGRCTGCRVTPETQLTEPGQQLRTSADAHDVVVRMSPTGPLFLF